MSIFAINLRGLAAAKNMPIEDFITIFSIPFVIVFFVSILIYLRYHDMHLKFFFKYFKPLDPEYFTILSSYPYYSKLNTQKKRLFEKRVNRFLINKLIVSDKGAEILPEQKIVIAASAIQISFGLRENYLGYFNKIEVFSDSKSEAALKVSEKGFMHLPWKQFSQGFIDYNDGINPALQAMATALMLEDKFIESSAKLFSQSKHANWKRVSSEEKERFKRRLPGIFPERDIKKEEFFSICVAYFFEKPEEFNTISPRLFIALSKLLQQNPLKN